MVARTSGLVTHSMGTEYLASMLELFLSSSVHVTVSMVLEQLQTSTS